VERTAVVLAEMLRCSSGVDPEGGKRQVDGAEHGLCPSSTGQIVQSNWLAPDALARRTRSALSRSARLNANAFEPNDALSNLSARVTSLEQRVVIGQAFIGREERPDVGEQVPHG
jgi:hypothetical protein